MKVEVDVTTFDVLEEIIAEPGDKLLIWKGKYVVGVLHKGEAPIASAVHAAVSIDEERVVAILRKHHDGLAVRQLGDEYGLDRGDSKSRGKLGAIIAKLIKAGQVHRHAEDTATRYPRYVAAHRAPRHGAAD